MRGEDGAIRGIISKEEVEEASEGDMIRGRRGQLRREDSTVGDIVNQPGPNEPLKLRPD